MRIISLKNLKGNWGKSVIRESGEVIFGCYFVGIKIGKTQIVKA